MRNLDLSVFYDTYMQSGFLNRCFAAHVEMTGRLKYSNTSNISHFEPNLVSVRNLNLHVFNVTYMQSGFLNRCFATHVEMTRLDNNKPT